MNFLTIPLQIGAGNIQGQLNQILSNYGTPIVVFIIILSAVGGVLFNLDKIMDSEGRGTRKEGILNVVYIVGGVILTVAIIGAIIALARNVRLTL